MTNSQTTAHDGLLWAIENFAPGSVWASADKTQVVVVTKLDGGAVESFGWVSYGLEGGANYNSVEGFLADYPVFVFRVEEVDRAMNDDQQITYSGLTVSRHDAESLFDFLRMSGWKEPS